jgi:hypothetical protein
MHFCYHLCVTEKISYWSLIFALDKTDLTLKLFIVSLSEK